MAGRSSTTSATVRSARKLVGFLSKHRRSISPLLILTHDYPDPDALASAFALAHLAETRYRIQTRIAYGGVIGRTENRAMVRVLRIPARRLRASDLKRYRHVALVDTQPGFENNSFRSNRRATLVIDQHPSSAPPLADLALVDPLCGATCVIVARALLLLKMEIPSRVATALAYGILSDTLDLYRARRQDVVETYLEILYHCDMKALARIQNPPRSRGFFMMLGRGIRNAVLQRPLMSAHLGAVETPDVVSQVAEFLLTYQPATWSLCTGRCKGRLCVSLRTTHQNVEAGEILRDVSPSRTQAGGHAAIAGGSFKVGRNASERTWRQAEETLQARLAKRLRIAARTPLRKPFAD
jgi:nanoRNase/pAp phosphatase (c-di-AMP/oligoRNAs hydrolase)